MRTHKINVIQLRHGVTCYCARMITFLVVKIHFNNDQHALTLQWWMRVRPPLQCARPDGARPGAGGKRQG